MTFINNEKWINMIDDMLKDVSSKKNVGCKLYLLIVLIIDMSKTFIIPFYDWCLSVCWQLVPIHCEFVCCHQISYQSCKCTYHTLYYLLLLLIKRKTKRNIVNVWSCLIKKNGNVRHKDSGSFPFSCIQLSINFYKEKLLTLRGSMYIHL